MTRTWRAGHLPGLAPDGVAWRTLRFASRAGAIDVELPVLADAAMQALATAVQAAARETLHRMTVDAIVRVLDRVVARFLDAADPLRRELDELLPIVTGHDAERLRLQTTAYLKAFRAPQLHRFVAEDFANPKLLDGFQPAVKGGAVRAFGPRLLVHSWAGNVAGLPLWSLVSGLLVKAASIGKLPSAEPVFASLFARGLADVDPALGACVGVVWWQGGDAAAAASLYAQADCVLAYGGNAALAEIRAQLPVTTRFLGYGHKVGAALVGRAALDAVKGVETARRLALDLVRHEQQGCYSPHAVYVERGARVDPRGFAQYLAAELANLERRHPAPELALGESAALAAWRQAAEWRAMAHEGAELIGDAAGWSVAFADAAMALAPTAGARCVQVSAVDALDEVPALLAPHAAYLQTVGVATTPEELYRLAEPLGAAGVTRVAPIGGMTQPEAGWHHDGRFNLADLVRMVEIEGAAERAADRFAPYAEEEGA
ncbi:acyl-CoA reductase [Piscinibacter koreensis]|uniref:Acyl-CoA reductase n=1 Tax=Piscinibacter koreensis TaxID=2742824 RepID=A0A7Y6TXP0_9BURK|nr:acyl-CoA reductase [Schlegelella koreensis]NUZ07265.1 acyl-CoA reductase [Schlegelella koreensis]